MVIIFFKFHAFNFKKYFMKLKTSLNNKNNELEDFVKIKTKRKLLLHI